MDAPSAWLQDYIRDVPDFPEPGIVFKDITPLLASPDALRYSVEALADHLIGADIDVVVGIDARGFIFGAPIACRIGCGFVPVRKKGKLPGDVTSVSYDLEYGSNCLELCTDAIPTGSRVAIIDDVLATGGTIAATIELCEKAGADVASASFLMELDFLGGRDRLGDTDLHVLVNYP